MFEQATQFYHAHHAAILAAAIAATHLSHLAWGKLKSLWPFLKESYPYCRANGGAIGIAANFLVGDKPPIAPAGPTNQGEKV